MLIIQIRALNSNGARKLQHSTHTLEYSYQIMDYGGFNSILKYLQSVFFFYLKTDIE